MFHPRARAGGIKLAFRDNIGMCIGSFRDLSLLLQFSPSLVDKYRSLVLINDSNLFLASPSVLLSYLNKIVSSAEDSPLPTLFGCTDSVQLNSYHLQSFFLYANFSLLSNISWLRFWLNLSVDSSKDELIKTGEIGLSQYLLSNGISLRALFPLVHGLLCHPEMSDELLSYGIHLPEDINQTLFAWRSLLDRGYPFIKKHVLFRLLESRAGHRLSISDLAPYIPANQFDLIQKDIHQLLINHNFRHTLNHFES